jgi:hypothetical protein
MKRLRIALAVSPLIVIEPWLWTSQTAPQLLAYMTLC